MPNRCQYVMKTTGTMDNGAAALGRCQKSNVIKNHETDPLWKANLSILKQRMATMAIVLRDDKDAGPLPKSTNTTPKATKHSRKEGSTRKFFTTVRKARAEQTSTSIPSRDNKTQDWGQKETKTRRKKQRWTDKTPPNRQLSA